MKEFEKIESLLKSKTYAELTASERSLIDKELNRETYEELHQSMALIQDEKLGVSKSVKQSLMKEFKQKDRSPVLSLFLFRIPAYTHVFSLALIVYLIFFMPRPEKIVPQDRIVEVMIRDTVKVTQVDTLLIERLIKVPTPVYVTQELNTEKPSEVVEVNNKALSGQKDVMDLVVRGLE